MQACIALTYPDRIHSFHLQHLAQPPPDASAAALVGDSARAGPPPSDELQALLKSLALTGDQRAVLICLRRMCVARLCLQTVRMVTTAAARLDGAAVSCAGCTYVAKWQLARPEQQWQSQTDWCVCVAQVPHKPRGAGVPEKALVGGTPGAF